MDVAYEIPGVTLAALGQLWLRTDHVRSIIRSHRRNLENSHRLVSGYYKCYKRHKCHDVLSIIVLVDKGIYRRTDEKSFEGILYFIWEKIGI